MAASSKCKAKVTEKRKGEMAMGVKLGQSTLRDGRKASTKTRICLPVGPFVDFSPLPVGRLGAHTRFFCILRL